MASTYNKEEYAEEQKKKLAEAADIIQDGNITTRTLKTWQI